MTDADERTDIQRRLEASLGANDNFVAARGDPLVQALLFMAVNGVIIACHQKRAGERKHESIAHFVLAHGRLATGWRLLPSGFTYGRPTTASRTRSTPR